MNFSKNSSREKYNAGGIFQAISLNHLLLRLISKQTNAKADDSNFNFNFSNLSYLRNLQEVKKAFSYQKLFWPFTFWINFSSDLKIFENSQPSALKFKGFSRSLEQFFRKVGQNNFVNKIPFFLITKFSYFKWPRKIKCAVKKKLNRILTTFSWKGCEILGMLPVTYVDSPKTFPFGKPNGVIYLAQHKCCKNFSFTWN